MKIISIATLKSFWEQYPDAEQPLKSWLDEAKKANWQSPMEIKELYRSASILKNSRVVFNIKGNDYRLVISIFYAAGWVYIKFIGTHKHYDKIDVNTVEIREVTK
ncbi:type II toxin-antitoxin system HigB family toxin [Serratia symbiotica]|uniref:type II toxin-antitoxin system HigB family toxin n=1 Tax=Serratia symbiotica TaxID=138074 RepID=UPI001CF01CC3|nr:type II toxin-antitoxin system HigB family toxin [Serratia symbiotica]